MLIYRKQTTIMICSFIVILSIVATFEFIKGDDSLFYPSNIVNLTENNFENNLKEKAHLVMFYTSEYVEYSFKFLIILTKDKDVLPY